VSQLTEIKDEWRRASGVGRQALSTEVSAYVDGRRQAAGGRHHGKAKSGAFFHNRRFTFSGGEGG
jgi:hypothetical protein